MRFNRLTAAACVGLGLFGASLAFTGCYEEINDAPRAERADDAADAVSDAAATQPADDESAAPRAYGNSQSTLGKARDSAKSTIADLEARDRELQKQIDDQ